MVQLFKRQDLRVEPVYNSGTQTVLSSSGLQTGCPHAEFSMLCNSFLPFSVHFSLSARTERNQENGEMQSPPRDYLHTYRTNEVQELGRRKLVGLGSLVIPFITQNNDQNLNLIISP